MLVSLRNPLIDKLLTIAGDDFELVNDAIRRNQKFKRWKWWQRKRWAADLADVVRYIVARKR